MIDAVKERIEAETLELAAQKLERLAGSEVYRFAFRRAARAIRELKPECRKIKEICNEEEQQIRPV
ncbi:hypothetical protein AB8A05_04115 [Tardiphaga sp. 538_B7_N1_4]|uniref:hypothetical protein n=1 Tax=Tardiphaga sp. 538_B7_N1_4 TaxID=3240778 RepID=UPI003F22B40C